MIDAWTLPPTLRTKNQDWLRHVAVVLVGMTANASTIVKPVLIGTYVARYAFSPRIAGYLLASEMTMAAIGTLISSVLFAHFGQRRFVVAGVVMILAGNIGAASVSNVTGLFLWRIFTGLGHGFALGPVGAAIARVEQPVRLAALLSIATMALGSLMSFVVPQVQALVGGRGIFMVMGSTVPFALIGLRWFPNGLMSSDGTHRFLPPMPPWRVTLFAFLGLFIWYLVVGGYWPYVEQFARAAHLDYTAALQVLGWATLTSLLGAMLGIVVGGRFGNTRMLAVLFAVHLFAVLTMLLAGTNFVAYASSATLFIFAWIALFTYLMGLMSEIDRGGRLNGVLYTAALMGYAIGPAGAGYLTGRAATVAQGLIDVQCTVLALLIVSTSMLLTLAMRSTVRARAA